MRHENPLEIFPYGAPPSCWKMRQIDPPPLPPGKSNPFCGGGMDIFWNYAFVCVTVAVRALSICQNWLAKPLPDQSVSK